MPRQPGERPEFRRAAQVACGQRLLRLRLVVVAKRGDPRRRILRGGDPEKMAAAATQSAAPMINIDPSRFLPPEEPDGLDRLRKAVAESLDGRLDVAVGREQQGPPDDQAAGNGKGGAGNGQGGGGKAAGAGAGAGDDADPSSGTEIPTTVPRRMKSRRDSRPAANSSIT